ncbi:periplasmic heavy metal sensor [uncultured Tateyamaria sp.]|uniref:periplasmic heavy metal sensor n=1 Tax=uncultured Tateyamaria sp. TaxID=455651 RepID=UPI002603B8DA|nr:periplasmic heavy metal sensor [uncultured Tateyamaria sp.]
MADTDITRRVPLWVKVLLTLSLAINLAVAGLVVGLAVRGGPLGGKGPGMGYAMPYVLALPKEDRRAVFGAVRNDPDLPGRSARRATYRDMLDLLSADTLDTAAVRAVLARQAASVGQVQSVAQSAWLEKVAAMSVQDRRAYAQRVQEVISRGGRGRPGPGKRD